MTIVALPHPSVNYGSQLLFASLAANSGCNGCRRVGASENGFVRRAFLGGRLSKMLSRSQARPSGNIKIGCPAAKLSVYVHFVHRSPVVYIRWFLLRFVPCICVAI